MMDMSDTVALTRVIELATDFSMLLLPFLDTPGM